MKRRSFVRTVLLFPFVAGVLNACKKGQGIRGKITGASAAIGHLLRAGPAVQPATETLQKKVVIIGSGISGLSAGRELVKKGIDDFIILELEDYPGGNSSYNQNEISAYPQGAHYVPIPNIGLSEYISFLKDCDVVQGFDDKGLPFYNELHLCFDSQERLFIHGNWQEGLIPKRGLQAAALAEIERFLALMNDFRELKGADGKYAFDIPLSTSSLDKTFTDLDQVTMKVWMLNNNFTNPHLQWYVNYCSRDDYGTSYDKVSAWAGIHYYASRKGKAANATHSDILTWPEGNGFLMERLLETCKKNLRLNALSSHVELKDDGVRVTFLDTKTGKKIDIDAEHCIIAAPQYVAARLLKDDNRKTIVKKHFAYTPWLVANITTNLPPQQTHTALSWDNVMYESKSLGYVNATHQFVNQVSGLKNFTYYYPFTEGDAVAERTRIAGFTHPQWCELVVNDLEKVHPGITPLITEINVTLWGHSMVQPTPGFLHGDVKSQLQQSIGDRIHFAHTDVAGISIFEEAFYQGLNAAKKVIQKS